MRTRLPFAVFMALWGCGGEPVSDAGPPPVDAGLDAALRTDAGTDAASSPPMCTRPTPSGSLGGLCGAGGACGSPGACLRGSPITLGDIGYASGMPDPDHPGEYVATGPSPIPLTFAPDGMCTTGCDLDSGGTTCGPCATCRSEIGGSEALQRLGIFAAWLALSDADGVCRAPCAFDAETTGGCPDGFTCDRWASVCLERCTSDAQCRVEVGLSSTGDLVVYEAGSAECDAATGRCRWTSPAGAAHDSACERDEDCPRDIGVCQYGHCATSHCELDAYPCPAGARCYEDGRSPGLCLTSCATIDDCPAGRTCRAFDDGGSNVCSPICDAANPCRPDERCFHVFSDPTLGVCQSFCDPTDAGIAGAVACQPEEVCRPVEGMDGGVCQAADRLCSDERDCGAGQTCERPTETDFYGRCTTP